MSKVNVEKKNLIFHFYRETLTDQNEIVNHLPVLNSNMEKLIF